MAFKFLGVKPPECPATPQTGEICDTCMVVREEHFRGALLETADEIKENQRGRMCCINEECFNHKLEKLLRVSAGETK